MSTTTASKLSVQLAPLLSRLELDSEGTTVLDGADSADDALRRLESAGRLQEATRLVAHALPKREAVWWACMCARSVPDPAAKPDDGAALSAAEAWVRRPDEAARRAAMAAAEASGFRSAEAWAAVGAFWSGGSMAPPEAPVVPPGEHLTGVAIAGSITLSAVRGPHPARSFDRFARFLAAARDIAAGGAGRIAPEAD